MYLYCYSIEILQLSARYFLIITILIFDNDFIFATNSGLFPANILERRKTNETRVFTIFYDISDDWNYNRVNKDVSQPDTIWNQHRYAGLFLEKMFSMVRNILYKYPVEIFNPWISVDIDIPIGAYMSLGTAFALFAVQLKCIKCYCISILRKCTLRWACHRYSSCCRLLKSNQLEATSLYDAVVKIFLEYSSVL